MVELEGVIVNVMVVRGGWGVLGSFFKGCVAKEREAKRVAEKRVQR